MTRAKKSWGEKLRDSKDLPKRIPMPEKLINSWVKRFFVAGFESKLARLNP